MSYLFRIRLFLQIVWRKDMTGTKRLPAWLAWEVAGIIWDDI
jgi:hypothetical protein